MRTAILPIALAGVVAANPAPAPTAAASLDTRAADAGCDLDFSLGRPVLIPSTLKAWLRTATPPDQCTDIMPATLTAGWMSYLGQLSSFVAHAGERATGLTDLCGSATYTVSIELCSTQGKIVVTDEDSGSTVTTITNTVKNPGAVILTQKNGKVGVASAAATPTATSDESESGSESTGGASSSSSVVKTSGKGGATTGAASTTAGESKTSSGAGDTETSKPKDNGAAKIGAGVAVLAAAALAL